MSEGPAPTDEPLSLPEVELLARERMSHMAYEYIASAVADEKTDQWNRESYHRIRLRPRVMEEDSGIDTGVTLLGVRQEHPIVLAPTAYHRVVHPDGEVATAIGAGAAGAPLVVSTATTATLEEIAAVATSPLWFQLYLQSERGFTRDLIQQAEAVGCTALCVTVDTARLGARNRQERACFSLPEGAVTPYLFDLNSGRRELLTSERVTFTWSEMEWLRSVTHLPIFLKGILTGEDGARAVETGAAGVMVSNHGGRNLDTLPATIDALPEVVARIGGRIPVFVDGGIRRGTDIIKAVALGADAVMIGRPYLYGLGVGGADGVRRVVQILRTELEQAMALCGRTTLTSLDRSVLWDGPARQAGNTSIGDAS